MLHAEALLAGKPTDKAIVEDLIRSTLEREDDKRWQPAGVTALDRNLLALASMVGGMSVELLPSLDKSVFPAPEAFDPDRYYAFVGQPADRMLAPLEPDILGELHALDTVRPRHVADTKRPDLLRRTAWRVKPDGMASFLQRVAEDFPEHGANRLLFEAPTGEPAERRAWSEAAFFIGLSLFSVSTDRGVSFYRIVTEAARVHPGEPCLRVAQAKLCTQLVIAAALGDRLVESMTLYGELERLVQAHPAEMTHRFEQARAASNLVRFLFWHGKEAEALRVIESLRRLAKRPPINGEVVSMLASVENDPFGGGSLEHRIVFAGPLMPVDPPEATEQARAYYQYIQDQGSAADPLGAQASFADLAAMAEAHPKLPDMRLWLARAARVYIYDLVMAGDLTAALAIHHNLHCLASRHPEERELRCQMANVAIELLLPTNQIDLVIAQSVYARVAAVSEAQPEDLGLQQTRARVIINLIAHCAKAKNVTAASALYKDAAELVRRHVEDEFLLWKQAQVATQLVYACCDAANQVAAVAAFRELEDILSKARGPAVAPE
jgi:hypothetical protein